MKHVNKIEQTLKNYYYYVYLKKRKKRINEMKERKKITEQEILNIVKQKLNGQIYKHTP